jgi:TolB-like protein
MKKIAAVLCAIVLTACATGPTYQAAQTSDFTQANYAAVDKLVAATAVPIVKNAPLLIATMVNIDSMNQSSRFGRLISEQIATRLTQLGYNVVEMKLRSDVYIKEGSGELLLSRDVRDLSKNYNAQVVVVGNYAVAAGYVYLTLKAVTVTDNRVVGATNYLLPLTENNRALLAPTKE